MTEVPAPAGVARRGEGGLRLSVGDDGPSEPGAAAAKLGLEPDEVLLRRFAEGRDPAALGELARRYERYLLGVAAGLMGGGGGPGGREERARDVVQEVWIKVIRSAGTFREDASVKTWLYRITVNRCRDERRRAKVGARSAVSLDGEALGAIAGDQPGGEPDSDAPVIDPRDRERLREAVDGLTDDEREVVVLCHHRGLTHAEAASALELPMGTLKTRLYRAMRRLGAAFEAEEDGGAGGLEGDGNRGRSPADGVES